MTIATLAACGRVHGEDAPGGDAAIEIGIDIGTDAAIVGSDAAADVADAADVAACNPAPDATAPTSPARWIRGIDAHTWVKLDPSKDGGVFVRGIFEPTDHFYDAPPFGESTMLVKLGADGAVQWRVAGPPRADGFFFGGAAGPDGSVILAGELFPTATFHAGPFTLSGSAGTGVLVQVDAGGSVAFARTLAPGSVHPESIAVDPSGGFVISGEVVGTVDLGGGAWTLSPRAQASFIARYDRHRELLWAARIPAEGTDPPRTDLSSVALAPDGRVLATGRTDDTFSFAGTTIGPAATSFSPFAIAFSAEGAPLWGRGFGIAGKGTGEGGATPLGTSPDGLWLVAGGATRGTDVGSGPRPGIESFLAAYAPDGSLRWATTDPSCCGSGALFPDRMVLANYSLTWGGTVLQHVGYDGSLGAMLGFGGNIHPFHVVPAPDGDVYLSSVFFDCAWLPGLPPLLGGKTEQAFVARLRPPP